MTTSRSSTWRVQQSSGTNNASEPHGRNVLRTVFTAASLVCVLLLAQAGCKGERREAMAPDDRPQAAMDPGSDQRGRPDDVSSSVSSGATIGASDTADERETLRASIAPFARNVTARPTTMSPRTALRSLHLTPPTATPLRVAARPSDTPAIPLAAMPQTFAETSAMSMAPRAMVAPEAMLDPNVVVGIEPDAGSSANAEPNEMTPAGPMSPTTSPHLMVEEGGAATTSTTEETFGTTGTSAGSPAESAAADVAYDTREIFYATDRNTIEATSARPDPTLPLYAAAFAFGCYFIAYLSGRGARSGFSYAGHVGIVALIAITSFVGIRWQRADELLVNDRVVYGTDRSIGGQLDLGKCVVTIPKTHQIGMVEAPSLLRLEITHDKAKHLVLDRVDRLFEDEFYTKLNEAVRTAKRPELFVFVHGYNVDFDEAAIRTAQLAYDLKYQGTAICYSWPSQGGFLNYTVDETNVVWTVPHLKRFLIDVVRHSGAEAVNLVAHSMGNRALTASLRELELELGADAELFNHVVLAAPDVDAEVFRQMAPAISRTADHVTLYASSNDNALIASKRIHGYPRAGESGSHLVIMPEIETIDVSTIDTSVLGHSYYGNSDSILTDIYHLVIQSLPARERRWLEPRSMDGLTYWVFDKRNEAEAKPIEEIPAFARRPSDPAR